MYYSGVKVQYAVWYPRTNTGWFRDELLQIHNISVDRGSKQTADACSMTTGVKCGHIVNCHV